MTQPKIPKHTSKKQIYIWKSGEQKSKKEDCTIQVKIATEIQKSSVKTAEI